MSELGDIELRVLRDRCFCPTKALGSYGRRRSEIDRFAGLTQPHRGHGPGILAGFVLGLSTRKVGEALLALFRRASGSYVTTGLC